MSQLINIELPWNINDRARGFSYGNKECETAFTEAEYNKLRDVLGLPPIEQRNESASKNEFVGSIDDLALLAEMGLEPKVSRVRGMFIDRTDMPAEGRIGAIPDFSSQTIINLTIPNAALFAVRSLMVVEDECTNRVQQYLDEGWRIVAVCPPNDTRRPTFILGHMEQQK